MYIYMYFDIFIIYLGPSPIFPLKPTYIIGNFHRKSSTNTGFVQVVHIQINTTHKNKNTTHGSKPTTHKKKNTQPIATKKNNTNKKSKKNDTTHKTKPYNS